MGDEHFKTPFTPHTHNNFLQIWYDFGFIGMLIVMPFLLWPLLRLKKGFNTETMVSISFYISILGILSIAYSIWQAWFVGALVYTYGLSIIFGRSDDKAGEPVVQKK